MFPNIRSNHRRYLGKGIYIMNMPGERYTVSEREQKRNGRILRLRRERRRKFLVGTAALTAVLCMVLICSVSYRAIRTRANNGFKYYTSITVEAGESLWDIAGDYMGSSYDSRDSYIAEVCSINHLADANDIMRGQTLIIPYYSSEYVR